MVSRRPAGRFAFAVQKAALVVGAVFVIAGLLGFVPGITVGYDTMAVFGHQSGALLLGIFNVSILHNVVHLLFGVIGIAAALRFAAARAYLIIGGISYLLLFVYGLLIDHHSAANFVPLNNADDWLHLSIGVGMALLGVLLGRSAPPTSAH
ncbi:DUF4383 domain-containing protein [Mycolicibacterium sp.]|uniref:DUF4383 domain-containing protein n=1 Tax=Mycolicibacterium sp. TaxID=2320850 RepID=UPI0037C7BA71